MKENETNGTCSLVDATLICLLQEAVRPTPTCMALYQRSMKSLCRKKPIWKKQAENIKTEADKKELIEKSEKMQAEWKVKIEECAKTLNGKPIEVREM